MYTLSSRVELLSPPLVFVDGRAYRLDPTVTELLTTVIQADAATSIRADDHPIISRLCEVGILTKGNGNDNDLRCAGQPRPRHPLAIHVRTYSPGLLRILRIAAVTYPLRTTTHAGLAISVGLIAAAVILWQMHTIGGVAGLLSRSSTRDVLTALALSVVAMILHESAHLAAAHRAGQRVPRAGMGIYLTHIVCFVDLTILGQAPARVRRHVDLAGMAADSLFLSALWFLGWVNVVSDEVVGLAAVSFAASLLFSLNPWSKSDYYWFLRDCQLAMDFDPANWLLHPRTYLTRLLRPAKQPNGNALLRVHFASGLAWLVTSLAWTGIVVASFAVQPTYGSDVIRHWLSTILTLVLSLIGLSAVALAFVKGSQWRNM